jgi:hypothetical protein
MERKVRLSTDIASTAIEKKKWQHARRPFRTNSLKERATWRVELLLWKDCDISKYTRAVSRQRFSKDIPAPTNMHATIEGLETVF